MLIKLKPHNTIAELHLRRAGARLISKENFTGGTPTAGMSLIQQGRYSYFYTNTRGDISSSLKHNANSLHSYMYDEYGMLYDNNPQEGGKITLGNMDASNFTQSHNDYTFQSKEYDSESGLNYFGARYLDSFSGTWTTNDIVRGNLVEPMSQHRTTYVHDNPVNLIDRYGYSAVGTNSTSEINNIKKGVQNFVMQPKTQNQGNTAGTIFDQFKLFNNNNQGSGLNTNPLLSNTNWGSQITNTFSTMFKNSQINKVINAFTGPQAERHHRAFALLNLLTGIQLDAPKWLEDWIDGDGGVSPEIVVPKIEENDTINKLNLGDMAISQSGLEFIAEREGFSAIQYKVGGVGNFTIGYGHELLSDESFENGISNEQALQLLRRDAEKAVNIINQYVTVFLEQYQFDALVSYVFNTGSLYGTKLLENLNNNDFINASLEMDIVTQNKVVLPGLVRRRELEVNLFLQGVYE